MRAIGEIWTTIKTLPRPIRQVFHVQVRLVSEWQPCVIHGPPPAK